MLHIHGLCKGGEVQLKLIPSIGGASKELRFCAVAIKGFSMSLALRGSSYGAWKNEDEEMIAETTAREK